MNHYSEMVKELQKGCDSCTTINTTGAQFQGILGWNPHMGPTPLFLGVVH
jgi:hypothetical protein